MELTVFQVLSYLILKKRVKDAVFLDLVSKLNVHIYCWSAVILKPNRAFTNFYKRFLSEKIQKETSHKQENWGRLLFTCYFCCITYSKGEINCMKSRSESSLCFYAYWAGIYSWYNLEELPKVAPK